MGRTPKHLTLSDKKAAQKEARRRYALSERGKAKRSARNARTYADRKVAQCTLVGVVLPPDMFKYASSAVRVAFMFSEGEDYALGLWSSPYMLIAPDSTVRRVYHRFVETSQARTAEWKAEALEAEVVEEAVRDELEARLHAWVAARDGGIGNGDGDLKYAHDVYLVWAARFAVCLGQEWEIRKRGLGAYEEAHARGQLPWQKVMRCIRAMLAT
ncbi:hypothetical protein C8T65DRAFT_741473 [Cerioporus squamosus]|nr:hypothetical protein C8T65DRAFT_741473 [Cerioporus squamosus]